MTTKKKGLGRGLEALLGSGATSGLEAAQSVSHLKLVDLQPGQYQPRTVMDEEGLEELAASIRVQGVIQPVLVRPLPGQVKRFEIIAGERRVRAAHRAGLEEVPVVIREVDDQSALAMALIENLQRRDLSPLEEAQGIERLIKEFGLTHEEAAQAVGRSRSATSNLLRLLALPEGILKFLREGRLEAGHARALLGLPAAQQRALAEVVVANGLSVRGVEDRVRDLMRSAPSSEKKGSRARREGSAVPADWLRMQSTLADHLGLPVSLSPRGKGGQLTVQFASTEELEGFLARVLPPEIRRSF